MDDTTAKRAKFLINLVYIASLFALAYLVFKYGLGMAMPFILALMVSALAQPIIGFLARRLHFPHGIASVVSVLFVFFTMGWLFVVIVSSLAQQVKTLSEYWPTLYDQISNQVQNYTTRLTDLFTLLPPYAADYVENAVAKLTDSLLSSVGSLTMPFLTFVTGAASKLPSIFVAALVTIAASILISSDYDDVRRFISLQLPANVYAVALDTKQFFKLTILRFMRAYMIICFITFVELNIGFMLLGVKNALLLSVLIALFDILPLFGSGGILIPWAVMALIFSNFTLALGLTILYLIVTSVRQIVEPKVIGSTIGLNPVASLLAIYCGLRFFGVVGMFMMPILLIVLKHMQDNGYIRLWKTAG
ncbi:Sodium-lithium/proton antiporter [bioreactor metagenome]|uniref:Sodium-lithium/proton antiporter n=1 Tax=bioreactor metagenome TaxID=1076179 RepID=A0A644XNI3_9ZZZZ